MHLQHTCSTVAMAWTVALHIYRPVSFHYWGYRNFLCSRRTLSPND